VEDDGVGCDPGRLTGRNTGRGGFGLSNIWERVVSLGGRVEVRSRPGQGTRIALFMPLAAPGASAQMTRRYLLTGRSQ